jgi:hypothetical protein
MSTTEETPTTSELPPVRPSAWFKLSALPESCQFIEKTLERPLTADELALDVDVLSMMRASISLLEAHDLCPRKSYYIFRVKLERETERSKSQDRGDAIHLACERFINGSDVEVKDGLARLGQDWMGSLRVKHREGRAHCEQWFNVQVGDLPVVFVGKMDVETDEGFVDHKSTSDLRWMKSEATLAADWQAMGYAYAWLSRNPQATECRALYQYFQTRGAPKHAIVDCTFSREDVEAFWQNEILPKICEVFLDYWKSAASLLGVNGRRGCGAFNRPCEYMEACKQDSAADRGLGARVAAARPSNELPAERPRVVKQYTPSNEEKSMAFDPKKFLADVRRQTGDGDPEPTPEAKASPTPREIPSAQPAPGRISPGAFEAPKPPSTPSTSKFDPERFLAASRSGAVVPPDAPEDHAPGVQLNDAGEEKGELEMLGLTPVFVARLNEIGVQTASEAARLSDAQVLALKGVGASKLAEFRKVFPQPLSKAGVEALEAEKAAIAAERTPSKARAGIVADLVPSAPPVPQELIPASIEGSTIEDYIPVDTPVLSLPPKQKTKPVQGEVSPVPENKSVSEMPASSVVGLHLYVNCIPTRGIPSSHAEVLHFEDLVAPYAKQVAEMLNAPHYTCIDYGKGPGMVLALFCEQESITGRTIVVSTGTVLGKLAVEVLRPLASFVCEGISR